MIVALTFTKLNVADNGGQLLDTDLSGTNKNIVHIIERSPYIETEAQFVSCYHILLTVIAVVKACSTFS